MVPGPLAADPTPSVPPASDQPLVPDSKPSLVTKLLVAASEVTKIRTYEPTSSRTLCERLWLVARETTFSAVT